MQCNDTVRACCIVRVQLCSPRICHFYTVKIEPEARSNTGPYSGMHSVTHGSEIKLPSTFYCHTSEVYYLGPRPQVMSVYPCVIRFDLITSSSSSSPIVYSSQYNLFAVAQPKRVKQGGNGIVARMLYNGCSKNARAADCAKQGARHHHV